MSEFEKAPKVASFKDSVILNLRRSQQVLRDKATQVSEKIVAIDELVTILEKDDGNVVKTMQIMEKLQRPVDGQQ